MSKRRCLIFWGMQHEGLSISSWRIDSPGTNTVFVGAGMSNVITFKPPQNTALVWLPNTRQVVAAPVRNTNMPVGKAGNQLYLRGK